MHYLKFCLYFLYLLCLYVTDLMFECSKGWDHQMLRYNDTDGKYDTHQLLYIV